MFKRELSKRYHTKCLESGCKFIFQDGDDPSVCLIKYQDDFERLCPWKITKRHKLVGVKEKNNENS